MSTEEPVVKGHAPKGGRARLLVASLIALGCAGGIAAASAGAAAAQPNIPASEQAAANRLEQAQIVVHRRVNKHAGAARAGCWAEIGDRYTLRLGGVTLAWAEVDVAGWCGNGRRITRQFGATYPKFHGLPYCWADVTTNNTWLAYPSWRHAQNTRQVGVPTPFGCLGVRTIHAHVRYAANGYWDLRY